MAQGLREGLGIDLSLIYRMLFSSHSIKDLAHCFLEHIRCEDADAQTIGWPPEVMYKRLDATISVPRRSTRWRGTGGHILIRRSHYGRSIAEPLLEG
jgi:hypothetical protein